MAGGGAIAGDHGVHVAEIAKVIDAAAAHFRGADGIAIAFVTPEQGQHLTDIEAYINKMIPEDCIEGFEAYTPKAVRLQNAPPEPPKVVLPVFGRRVKRYSNRL